MFSFSSLEVNPLARFLHCALAPLGPVAILGSMKKRTAFPLVLISIFGALCLEGCSENSGWNVGPEGIPLNSAPSGTSNSSSQ